MSERFSCTVTVLRSIMDRSRSWFGAGPAPSCVLLLCILFFMEGVPFLWRTHGGKREHIPVKTAKYIKMGIYP